MLHGGDDLVVPSRNSVFILETVDYSSLRKRIVWKKTERADISYLKIELQENLYKEEKCKQKIISSRLSQ